MLAKSLESKTSNPDSMVVKFLNNQKYSGHPTISTVE